MIVDDKICWKPQINYIRTKLAKSITILGKTKNFLDHYSLHILYSSLVLPYRLYSVEVWGNTFKSNLQPLCILQKKAIRIIHNVGYREHTDTLFLVSHALKFMNLVKFKTVLIMFKARNNSLPGIVQKCFVTGRGVVTWEENFIKQCVHTTKKSLCISMCGVDLWNRLADDLKKSTNVNHFKKLYKKQTLDRYLEEEKLFWGTLYLFSITGCIVNILGM